MTILNENVQFFSIDELKKSGLSYYKINKLVKDGKLIKRNKKIYENTEYKGDMTDFSNVSPFTPNGVFCMMSAARYYNLTNYLPDAVDVAIERSMKISTLPGWPDIRIWYFPDKRYKKGVSEVSDEAGDYRMYDVEKTVVDIIYYRNKIGIEEMREILKNYLSKKDRDLNKLHNYAKELNCDRVLQTYLEVLL